MPKNMLVINVESGETRVALIEDGIITELQVERSQHRTTVGNIYLGRVTRVLPGMQAAFVDIGQERAAFLHVEDLIRPEDFEAYLAGRGAAGDDDEASEGSDEEGGEGDSDGGDDEIEGAEGASDTSESPGKEARRSNRRMDRRGKPARGKAAGKGPARVSRSTPIRDVVREGQDIVVQVAKDPIGTKGARVTSHVSLPGRYVVYMPTIDHVATNRIVVRAILREAIDSMRPPKGGLIVRTVAEGLTKKQLKADIGYLVRLWGEIVKKRESQPKVPCTLYTELDLVLRTARDQFGDEIEKIVIDERGSCDSLRRFTDMFMPERVKDIDLYEGRADFDAYGIETYPSRVESQGSAPIGGIQPARH
jgi:ribonuclease G